MYRLEFLRFPHLFRVLSVTGLTLSLSGCFLFRSEDIPENDSPYSDITPVSIIDVTSGKTNLLTQTTDATDSATSPAAAASGGAGSTRIDAITLPSPNYDRRRLPVSLIVLHYTAAPLRESLNALRSTRGRNRVSAHYVVAQNGAIYRLVDESMRAWHAGVARWGNIEDVNSASIGIEMVNLGHDRLGRPRPYPTEQVEAVTRLCLNLQSRHDIRAVVGHSDVAPQRKVDPGELFPWGLLARRGVKVRSQPKSARR